MGDSLPPKGEGEGMSVSCRRIACETN